MGNHLKRASVLILLANVVVFISMEIYSLFGRNRTLAYLIFGAQFGPLVDRGEWFRLFTSMFLHAGILHILFNSYALYIFGLIVEEEYGPWRFLTYYLTSGFLGNLATQFFYHDSLSLGASGAIFGLIGVQFALGLKKETPFFMRGFTGMSLLPLIIFNILYGFIPGSGVNNAAHIGGFLCGMAFGYLTRLPSHWTFHTMRSVLKGEMRLSDLGAWKSRVIVEMVWMVVALVLLGVVFLSFVDLVRTVTS